MTQPPVGTRAVLPHLALALVAAGSLWAAPAAQAQDTPAATVVEVSGPVTWHPGHEMAFKDAKVGDLLHTGAIIRTGVRGNARLKWRNGGDFRLLPLSELAIPEDEGVLVRAGKVWAQFQEKLLAPFYFKSPSATAVVRGTILAVSLNPDESTTVEVLEGRVEVTSAQGGPSRMLEPGQSLIVTPFGGLGPIQPVGPGLRMLEQPDQAPPMRPGPGPGRMPGDRPERGPDHPAMRGPGPRPQAVEWLGNNRAAVRLEPMRQLERDRREMRLQASPQHRPYGEPPAQARPPRWPGPRPRPGDPLDRQPVAADPNTAFPAGRPFGPAERMPLYCDPHAMQSLPPGVMPECPPPPPPPPSQMPPGGQL